MTKHTATPQRIAAADAFRAACVDAGTPELLAASMAVYWESRAPRTRLASDAARAIFAEWKAENGWAAP